MKHHDAWHDDRIKEECGVVGFYVPGEEVARLAFFGLFALQHRGQESAGIAASDGEKVRMHKDMGLVGKVFNEQILDSLPGHVAVGHTRYSTAGGSEQRNAQPIFCVTVVGEMAVAHNGNLTNSIQLHEELKAEGHSFETNADSELIAILLMKYMELGVDEAVTRTMKRIEGAYSVAICMQDRLIGFRDPFGVRPLSLGRIGDGWMLSSESCAFDPVAAHLERDILPGECVVIDSNGMHSFQAVKGTPGHMCLFEFIYFARPDSTMYDTTLYQARKRMGIALSQEHPVEADMVVPVPDSGIPAAIGYAEATGIPFGEGMMKSRYIHRTFIQPDQRMRELGVRMKLSPLKQNIQGKRIVLVDDSIVRGTTTDQIVRMMFENGATEVHVRITAPPIMHPCFYGIDMASRGQLIAANKSIEEIRVHLGATSLGYLSVEGAMDAVGKGERRFCNACFTGNYPIKIAREFDKDALIQLQASGEMATVKSGQLLLEVE
ncbi:MAG: amidophosphoribosyltransferase [Fimbriimonadaceae bacterium]